MSLATDIEEVAGDAPQPVIQPAPDAWCEAEWIAGEVKKLIVQEGVEPHEIAIVARTGLEDTRRTLQVLRSAGMAATARLRAPLVEIGAIKAILVLFRAAAEDWSYPNLRRVLTNPYYKTRVDVRTIDRIAREARPHSLADWTTQLANMIAREAAEADSMVDGDRKEGMKRRIERYRATAPQLEVLFPTLARLDDDRTVPAWIHLTRDLLLTGWLDFRRRVCRPPMERTMWSASTSAPFGGSKNCCSNGPTSRRRIVCSREGIVRQPVYGRHDWLRACRHARFAVEALAKGLMLFDDARKLADRVPLDELLTFVLDRSGYRNHLLLRDGHREALGNLRAFIHCAKHTTSCRSGRVSPDVG